MQKILPSIVEKCANCIAAARPISKRTVSISGIILQFNHIFFVDHFRLDNARHILVVDHYSQYSVVHKVPATVLKGAIVAFKNPWTDNFDLQNLFEMILLFDSILFESFLRTMRSSDPQFFHTVPLQKSS